MKAVIVNYNEEILIPDRLIAANSNWDLEDGRQARVIKGKEGNLVLIITDDIGFGSDR